MLNRHIRQSSQRRRLPAHVRSGFTLVELMIVIGLILLIAVMTAAAINTTISGDKVRGASRQVQSYLAGARDRAIYSKENRGVRFLLDPTNNRTVTSMVYIKQTEDWTQGTIELDWFGGTAIAVRGFDNTAPSGNQVINPTGWVNLYNQGLLRDGLRIRIPNDNTGEWYTISTSQLANASPDLSGGPIPPVLLLTIPYGKSPTNTSNTSDYYPAYQPGEGPTTYLLELPPSVLPNQEPVLLPKGSCIHLDRCSTPGTASLEQASSPAPPGWVRADKLPSAWKRATSTGDPSGFDYTSQMDVMFSPRGIVVGTAAQNGIIHFYLADQKDADMDRQYWLAAAASSSYPTLSPPEFGFWSNAMSPNYERGDKAILTIFTRTGAVSTHPVHPVDTFKFAETGEVAGK
jgi:prepilin-type N-terminal cleavage/methylation domain-containing protein